MTYFYKVGGSIARKIGGTPPAKEYVAIDSENVIKHIKNGEVIEEREMAYPIETIDNKDLKNLYEDLEIKKLARDMLFPKYRKKKTTKSKPTRKVKINKKCKCK